MNIERPDQYILNDKVVEQYNLFMEALCSSLNEEDLDIVGTNVQVFSFNPNRSGSAHSIFQIFRAKDAKSTLISLNLALNSLTVQLNKLIKELVEDSSELPIEEIENNALSMRLHFFLGFLEKFFPEMSSTHVDFISAVVKDYIERLTNNGETTTM